MGVFKNWFQVSKYLTFLGTHISYAKTIFKDVKNFKTSLAIAIDLTCCHSIRANTRNFKY